MKHRVSLKKLSKTPAHRKAMMRNMLVALFREERIKTTFAKARVLRRFAERLITRARKDGVHNRRMARKWVQDKAILNKLFTELGPRYVQRPGGYTRIVKLGPRYGDASEMAYIALVVDEAQASAPTKKSKKRVKSADTKSTEVSETTELVDDAKSAEASASEKEEKKDSDVKTQDAAEAQTEVHKEQKTHHEQPKHTSKTAHAHVASQKAKMPSAVQQKAQRYRSDKGK